MRRGSMGFQRSIVLILFVNEEAPWLGLVAVHLIYDAARLLARFLGKFRKHRGNFGFVTCFRHPRNHQYHYHPLLIAYKLGLTKVSPFPAQRFSMSQQTLP